MNRSLKLSFASLTTLFGAAIVVACSSGAQNDSETSGSDLAATNARMIPSGCNHKKAAVNGHAQASCYSVHLDSTKIDHPAVINGAATTTPSGFGPSDIQSAYNIPSSFAPNSTVAVVDAQDNPNAESDLAVYRAQFGLPACTTANGCFKKVSQTGSTTGLPSGDTDWGGEIALDLDMVSAACPSCKILLVETNSQADTDLAAGVDEAVKLGAQAVSNSYGWSEDSSSSSDATHYTHAGVLVTGERRRQRHRRFVPGDGRGGHRGRRHLARQGLQLPRLDGDGLGEQLQRRHRLGLQHRLRAAVLPDDRDDGLRQARRGGRLRRCRPADRRGGLRHLWRIVGRRRWLGSVRRHQRELAAVRGPHGPRRQGHHRDERLRLRQHR